MTRSPVLLRPIFTRSFEFQRPTTQHRQAPAHRQRAAAIDRCAPFGRRFLRRRSSRRGLPCAVLEPQTLAVRAQAGLLPTCSNLSYRPFIAQLRPSKNSNPICRRCPSPNTFAHEDRDIPGASFGESGICCSAETKAQEKAGTAYKVMGNTFFGGGRGLSRPLATTSQFHAGSKMGMTEELRMCGN